MKEFISSQVTDLFYSKGTRRALEGHLEALKGHFGTQGFWALEDMRYSGT